MLYQLSYASGGITIITKPGKSRRENGPTGVAVGFHQFTIAIGIGAHDALDLGLIQIPDRSGIIDALQNLRQACQGRGSGAGHAVADNHARAFDDQERIRLFCLQILRRRIAQNRTRHHAHAGRKKERLAGIKHSPRKNGGRPGVRPQRVHRRVVGQSPPRRPREPHQLPVVRFRRRPGFDGDARFHVTQKTLGALTIVAANHQPVIGEDQNIRLRRAGGRSLDGAGQRKPGRGIRNPFPAQPGEAFGEQFHGVAPHGPGDGVYGVYV